MIYTQNTDVPKQAVSDKVYVLVVDGMRKDRFEEADAPFMKQMRAQGTEYTQMETVYPARTVVCFSSNVYGYLSAGAWDYIEYGLEAWHQSGVHLR